MSTPATTEEIAEQMERDRDEQELAMGPCPDWAGSNLWNPARSRVVAAPEDTDNGQCWSEEIFSLLNP